MARAVALGGQAGRGDDRAGQRVAEPAEEGHGGGIVVVEDGGLRANQSCHAGGVGAGADDQVGAEAAGQGQHPQLARQQLAGAAELAASDGRQDHVGDAEGAEQLQGDVLVASHHHALVARGRPGPPDRPEDVRERGMGDVDEGPHPQVSR